MRTVPGDAPDLPPGFRWMLTHCGRRLAVPLDLRPVRRDPQPEKERPPPRPPQLRSPPVESTADASIPATARRVQRRRGTLPVYTLDDLQDQVDRLGQCYDRDLKARDTELLRQLAQRGPWRKASVNARSLKALEALAEEMPHCAGIIQVVRNQLLLAQAARRPPRLRPMLLVGPPGLGKSHFAERFAAALRVPVHRLSMDAVQTTSALSGGDSHWSNSQIGLVFQALGLGPVANPVIVLDEIDKACLHGGHDPLAPLHGLLEPLTARRFADRSLPLPLDARFVVWIATANDLEALDAPLRSRFAVHRIAPPDAQQALRLAKAIAQGLLGELGLRLGIPEAVFQRLTACSPREQRQTLETAIAKAVAEGRQALTVEDLPPPATEPRRGMGFLWTD